MIYLNAFIVCGIICAIAQIIYENTKLTPGHITSLFVVFGCILELFNIYDKIIDFAGMGASIPIISFGHSLMHATINGINQHGIYGLLNGTFDLVSGGIGFAIFIAFIVAITCKVKS